MLGILGGDESDSLLIIVENTTITGRIALAEARTRKSLLLQSLERPQKP